MGEADVVVEGVVVAGVVEEGTVEVAGAAEAAEEEVALGSEPGLWVMGYGCPFHL